MELRVGRVGHGFGRGSATATIPPVGATLATILPETAELLRLDYDHAILADALVAKLQEALANHRAATRAAMSKRRCTALATLLTFCPPAPRTESR